MLGEGLALTLLVEQRLQPTIDAVGDPETGQVVWQFDLEMDFGSLPQLRMSSYQRCDQPRDDGDPLPVGRVLQRPEPGRTRRASRAQQRATTIESVEVHACLRGARLVDEQPVQRHREHSARRNVNAPDAVDDRARFAGRAPCRGERWRVSWGGCAGNYRPREAP